MPSGLVVECGVAEDEDGDEEMIMVGREESQCVQSEMQADKSEVARVFAGSRKVTPKGQSSG